MLRFVLLAVLAFCLTEASHLGHYGRAASHNGHESSVNKNNAVRQLNVNHVANHVGSGSGTAYYDGVPGTPLGHTGHNSYGQRNSYGAGYGNNVYGNGYNKNYDQGYGNGYNNNYGQGYGNEYNNNYGQGYGNGYNNNKGNNFGHGTVY